MKHSIKSLLKYILNSWTDFKDYKILTNSQINNKARIQKISTSEIINIEPSDFGFASLGQNLEFEENELLQAKEKFQNMILNTNNIKSFTLKTLLQEILKDNDKFEVMTNSVKGGFSRVRKISDKSSYNFHPRKFGFSNLDEIKDFSKNDFDELKEKVLNSLKSKISETMQKNQEKTVSYNIKSLLQEIYKDSDFMVMDNSNEENVARLKYKFNTQIIKINPAKFGFKSISENKDFTQSEFENIKTKFLEFTKNKDLKEYSFEIRNLLINYDFGINEILNLKDNGIRLGSLNKIIIGATELAIQKHCTDIKITKPVILGMSFKSNLDVSNHSYMFKIIEDCLVNAKILEDDSNKFVKAIYIEKHTDGDAA
ncbi:MAG: hypothetical protein IJR18_00585, partial [Campylobacter sp.]|nr:hypothetical protein [Campylobacter sp.]